MALGNNIRKLRKLRGWTQGQLAERASAHAPKIISQAVISQLESSDAKSSGYVAAIARALRVSAEQLYNDDFVDDDGNLRGGHLIARPADNIPVYRTDRPMDWVKRSEKDAIDMQLTPKDLITHGAFWVEQHDDSCAPNYTTEARYLIHPRQAPQAGSLVLGELPDGTAEIRIYRRPTPAGYSLDPINTNYAPYTLDDGDRKKLIGVVASVISPPPKF